VDEEKEACLRRLHRYGRDPFGHSVSGSVYFCRIVVDEFTAVYKVLLQGESLCNSRFRT